MLFGALTIFAGTRVLTGADPGYVVFLPLLIYNTAMGAAYVAVGTMAWRHLGVGRKGAAAIFGLNLIVLIAVWALHQSAGAVAVDSVRAMGLRTGVWFVLFVGFWWLGRKRPGRAAE